MGSPQPEFGAQAPGGNGGLSFSHRRAPAEGQRTLAVRTQITAGGSRAVSDLCFLQVGSAPRPFRNRDSSHKIDYTCSLFNGCHLIKVILSAQVILSAMTITSEKVVISAMIDTSATVVISAMIGTSTTVTISAMVVISAKVILSA